jgi:actin related protein 2/3 complex subunit 1A/1B
MPAKQQKPIQLSISFHAWNADRSMVALSPNSSEVWIYKTNGKLESDTWGREPTWKLTEHGGYISGIDWHAGTNTLVTCGHDRNAYVWKLEGNEWKPTLVILRINRAATTVKWSPNGQKFAVASGAKCVPICHFDPGNDWWISKMVKKHKSTVLSVDWSPNSKYIVTGACDFKCRILSAYIEGLDDSGADDFSGMWPAAHTFGEELAVFDGAAAWVNNVSWSPSGKRIAFVGQGASIHFVDLPNQEQRILQDNLPYLLCEFLSDDSLIAVGFDNNPRVYTNNGGTWQLAGKADPESDKPQAKAVKKGFGSAFSKFQQADKEGAKFGSAKEESKCLTYHKNTVLDLKLLGSGGLVKQVSTSSLCGRLLAWDLSNLNLK